MRAIDNYTPEQMDTLRLKGMLPEKTMTNTERTELQLRNQTVTMAEQINRLDTELVQMRKINQQQMAFLQDAAAFIRITASHKGAWNRNILLSTLIHDITGLARDEECFLPRVTGYAKREQENQ